MDKQQLQHIFTQEYKRENWLKLFPAIFPKFEQLAIPTDFETNNKKIESLKQLGTLILKDDKKIAVFEVKVSDKTNLARNRVELNNIISGFIDQWQTHAAIGVFYSAKSLDYRFTFAQRQTVWGRKGMEEIKTHSKRYTYVLGPNEFCKTPTERFANLAERKSIVEINDIIEAFSVEKLSKQFYNELSHWYFWAIKHVTFPSEPTKNDAYNKKAKLEDMIQEHNAKNVIRLLTRFLFVWFIKQKKLIPDELFDLNTLQKEILNEFSPYHEDGLFKEANRNSIYYKAILQNLFFASLNCPINTSKTDKRARGFRLNNSYGQHRDANYMMRYENYFKNPDKFLELMNSVVPFLNGGLFECLDDKLNNIYIDGFSDHMIKGEKLIVPDYLFFGLEEKTDLTAELGIKNKSIREASVKGLINILKSYNFTIVENTPIDEEVALDPELLGKVFENLLASYNPETKTTARKQTGSFYTPREIVDYMVDESLKASIANSVTERLSNCTEDDIKAGLDILFAYTDSEHAFTESEVGAIIETVSNLKILDPACGSGAFPMGILHKLVFILEKLDPDNTKWRALQKAKVIQETDEAYNMRKEERNQRLEEIKEAFDYNSSNYGRKLFLVENCIYGLDIQPIATQISKLRFFISLIVDQIVDKTKENFSILPLPNLETKFVTANTLIGIDKNEGFLPNLEIDELEKQLKDIRHRLFSSKSPSHKRKLREGDKLLRINIAEKLEKNGLGTKSAQQLAQWDPYDQNTPSPFFDMDWMFGIKDGFDIVIGNPPYIKEHTDKRVFDGLRDSKYYQGKMDLWYFFACKSLDFLIKNGILTFIATNNWVSNAGASKLRNKILEDAKMLEFVDFGDYKIFESAGIQTMVFINKKTKDNNDYSVNYSRLLSSTIQSEELKNFLIKEPKDIFLIFDSVINKENMKNKNITFTQKNIIAILERIESNRNFLIDGNKEISSGIDIPQDFVNRNSLQVLGKNFRLGDGIFVLSDEEKINLRLNDEEKLLIKPFFTTKEFCRYKSLENNKFWIIYTNSSFKNPKNILPYPNIKNHLDKYEKVITSENKPYGLNRARDEFYFKGEKIVIQRKCPKAPSFSYVNFDTYFNRTFIPLKTNRISLKYLTALLNSKLVAFWLRHKGKMQGNNYQIDKAPILSIPIKKIDDIEVFLILVDYLMLLNRTETAINEYVSNKFIAECFEDVIDTLVFEVYFDKEFKEAGFNFYDNAKNDFMTIEGLSDVKALEIIHNSYQKLRDKRNKLRNDLKLLNVRLSKLLTPITKRY